MSHSNTQRLTDYWQSRRGDGLAPLRAHVDPSDFADLLPQVFVLGRMAAGRYEFRLAGSLIERLHGRGLRHADFAGVWRASDRIGLQTATESALRRGAPMVIDAQAGGEVGDAVKLEILLAPMISHTGQVDRFLGMYQPTGSLAALQDRPIASLTALHVRLTAQPDDADHLLPRLKLAAVNGRRIA